MIYQFMDLQMDGPSTSKKLFDIYSLSHFVHGFIIYFVLSNIINNPIIIVIIGILLEILWEWFENTPYIINKYRSKSQFTNYRGDSTINILGDILVTVIGIIVSLYSQSLSIVISLLLELITIPFKANFLYLSLGSLFLN